MEPIAATAEMAEAEGRLEWLLGKLHQQSLARRSRLTMPVLIGGTALRRAYRLTRPSTDLDFAVADEQEMRGLLRAVTKIARERWPGAKAKLREDDEQGWRIDDENGQPMLYLGGLAMAPESLELALWVRETWTLPITRLAAMKIKAGIELRSQARDLYDMGFIAEHYPGDITTKLATEIRHAGWEATDATNRWTRNYQQDGVLHAQSLKTMGDDVAQAAGAALTHIEGAKQGQWANQSVAAAGLRDAVEHQPQGIWDARAIDDRVRCTWRGPDGERIWEAIIENEIRVRGLLMQANVDGHPQLREQMGRLETNNLWVPPGPGNARG